MSSVTTDHVEERVFLAALRKGDANACERLVRDHTARILAVARRMLGNEEDARDAVQEAFAAAFRSIDRFKGESRVGTWLHRIVVNACLMRIRAKRRRPERSIEDLLPRFTENGHRVDSSAAWPSARDHQPIDEDTRRIVQEAMAQLPHDYRNVLLLRDIEGLSTLQAARALETTEGAVKVRLHRARLALRELIQDRLTGVDA